MNPEEIVEAFKKEFGEKMEIGIRESGKGKRLKKTIWATVDGKDFHKVAEYLFVLQPHPHFSVSSGSDTGREIEINNHFVLNQGNKLGAVPLTIKVKLPKRKPEMETITDLIPGALISEQEKMEMLGIKIKGVPEKRVFTDESMPSGVFPWRKDSKGADKIARNLHQAGKALRKGGGKK